MEKILGYDKDKLYMVHLTDYFPNDHKIHSNYDGNRMFDKNMYGESIKIFLGNEVKAVIVPAHRHTVHFAINSVVENPGDGAGNWDEKQMAIIEPLAQHREQFISLGGDSFTWGSVNLSDNAIIIISKEALDLIPKDEKENWNFIICEGDISHQVKNFFIKNNLPLRDFPENDAGHACSIAYKLERNLEYRDMAINFVGGNTFDGKRDIEFTLEEFSRIISVCQDPQNTMNCRLDFIRLNSLIDRSSDSQNYSIFNNTMRDYRPSEIIETIIASGFYIREDGKVKLKNDEDIYDRYKKMKSFVKSPIKKQEENSVFVNNLIGEASQLYYKYIEVLLNKPKEKLLDHEKQIIQQTIQAIEEKEYTDFNESEKMIYLLNAQTSNLSERQAMIVKQLRPNRKEIDANNSIETFYETLNGEIKVVLGGNYLEDFQKWKEKFRNVKRSKMR